MCTPHNRTNMNNQTTQDVHTLKRSALHLSRSPTSTMQFPGSLRQKKKVRFNDDSCPDSLDVIEHHSPPDASDHESQHVHLQPEDYSRFRGAAHQIAMEVMRIGATQPPSPRNYDAVLTRAFEFCAVSTSTESDEDVDGDVDGSELADSGDGICLPPALFTSLTHWVKSGHIRRGLEKYCVSHHIQNRPLERKASIQAVMIAQHLLTEARFRKELNKENTSENDADQDKIKLGSWEFPLSMPDDEIVRMVSQRFTATSRRFGTAIGHADAAAVGNYIHTPEKSTGLASALSDSSR
jgi:hypothetical protein